MGLCTIKATADFKRVRGGARWAGASFAMEARRRREQVSRPALEAVEQVAPAPGNCSRFGFTVTRKLGNAVVRNRIRRRLKHAIRSADASLVRPGHDYVVVARTGVIDLTFADLRREIEVALKRIYRQTGQQSTRNRSGPETG